MVTPIYKNWAPLDSLSRKKFKYFCCLCTPMFSYVTICNTSKSKSGGYSWGILHGRPMEGLAFRYDRRNYKIYSDEGYALSFNGNACFAYL